MSGDSYRRQVRYDFERAFRSLPDAELLAMIEDLCAPEYGRPEPETAGPLAAWEYVAAGDWDMEDFDEACARFKAKWLRRDGADALEFYAERLQEECDRCKAEIAGLHVIPKGLD